MIDSLIHGNLVAMNGKGVLILGEPGSGKSDLCLRLIDRGATLVGDDQLLVRQEDGRLIGRSPHNIAGHIEVRGIGIIHMPYEKEIDLNIAIRLTHEGPRFPIYPETYTLEGISIIQYTLDAHAVSTPIKIELAIQQQRKPTPSPAPMITAATTTVTNPSPHNNRPLQQALTTDQATKAQSTEHIMASTATQALTSMPTMIRTAARSSANQQGKPSSPALFSSFLTSCSCPETKTETEVKPESENI